MMASPPPTLTTIPREIRDQIWEYLFIKTWGQDPAASKTVWPPHYPLMKAAIYLVNSQLNQEHNENLRKRDKRRNPHICTDGLSSLVIKGHDYRYQLSYPSLVVYEVEVYRFHPVGVNSVLTMMMFVAYQMRKQTVHRHRRMVMSVNACEDGMYLDRTIKNKRSIANASADVDAWGLYYGNLHLEINVMELSLTRVEGTLRDTFDFEKRVTLALGALRELPEGDNTDCDPEQVPYSHRRVLY